MAFVDRVSATGDVDDEWSAFIDSKRRAELEEIIDEESLKPAATKAFLERAFRDGAIPVAGTAVTEILPPASRFSADGGHGEKKQRVLARLTTFFERFFGLGQEESKEEG